MIDILIAVSGMTMVFSMALIVILHLWGKW